MADSHLDADSNIKQHDSFSGGIMGLILGLITAPLSPLTELMSEFLSRLTFQVMFTGVDNECELMPTHANEFPPAIQLI
ncbi:hypothetical protein [Lactiplantibacillus pentosus]|uniref:hypothetical protein n=1 Tax=Lactiplantibacillus pentosus TaxID=1589 RepID=UPI000B33C416|nr:hypothetical protein [Lactiplantibacillus pentosus]MCC3162624.1 hypothetical protein [Lactiplantibacillus pentosus]MCJ8186621.1 hypothetical protein [Lactiplantibacillus pentosus]UZO89879.1 hypothetical protein HPK28_07290 [Lactiplantibacillus pentosus]